MRSTTAARHLGFMLWVLAAGPSHADALRDAPVTLDLTEARPGTPPVDMTPTEAGEGSIRLTRTFFDGFDAFELFAPPWRYYPDRDAPDTIEGRTLVDNEEQQVYVDPRFAGTGEAPLELNPFEVSDGIMQITGRQAPDAALPFLDGYEFVSGFLSTERYFEQQYGFFEARMRLPEGDGVWPAFWMKRPARLRAEGEPRWPPEIDIMEFIGRQPDQYHVTVHWDFWPNNKKSSSSLPLPDATTRFRNYGVLWTEDRTVFYIDRVPHHVIETKPNHHVPMFLMLNLALGGKWPGPVGPDVLPAVLEIDWVAAWQLPNQ